MTPTEAVVLCRFAQSFFPQQHFDEYTPDAWHETLGAHRFEDCKAAVVEVSGSSPWVTPKDILAEVKRARGERIDRFGPIEVPPDLSPVDTCKFLGAARRRIADGEVTTNADLGVTRGVLIEREVDYGALMPRIPDDNQETAP